MGVSKEVFTFKKQIGVGNVGESLFLKTYAGSIKSTDLKYDFTYNGKTVELKTDTYPMEKTANYFMEQYGSIEDKKLGGPWRAAQDNVDFFVYLYLADKKFFWFETKALKEFLDKQILSMRGKSVWNKGYTTFGFAVPRDILEHLVIKNG